MEAAKQALDEYYRVFSRLDVQAVPPLFPEPWQCTCPAGVLTLPTRAGLVPVFQSAMEDLRARGYGRSELALRSIQALNENIVLAVGVAIRYKVDGLELERAGVTYVLFQGADG